MADIHFLTVSTRRPDMATVSQGTAQIFKFPPRGRFALGGNDPAGRNVITNLPLSHAVSAALSGAWYHDEAVREAEQPRKN
jgi:hypothetical protein